MWEDHEAFSLTYTIELEIDLLQLDPTYPKDPKTFGERIRTVRMNRHMMAKELAEQIGVVPDTVINWEKRNLKPTRRHWERLQAVLGLDGEAIASDQG
ncbi:MAG: helix-turn-helix transcriptional regulator [Candidatus Omnitrophica bacterium]|nr:helix-turn-helix transcriptional regulator [Candidatus Omnitrophota bacterium]